MRKVIDAECDLPPDENGRPRKFETTALAPGYGDPKSMDPPPGYGFANYERIFRARVQQARGAEATGEEPSGMSLDAFVQRLDEAGVETGEAK